VKTGDWTPKALAGAVTLGFFGVLGYMIAYGLPAQGGEALLVMLGTLGTAWGAIVSYYFGSSAGSKEKTEAMNRMTRK
jgi:predicted permease